MTTEFLKATEHITDRVLLINPLDTAIIFSLLLNTTSEINTSLAFPRGRIIAIDKKSYELIKENGFKL